MNGGGIVVGRPHPPRLAAMLAAATETELTYSHVGSTLDPGGWPDRSPYRRERRMGDGEAMFETAVAGLRGWVCHRGIQAKVHPADATLEEGETLLVVLPAGPVSIVVPNRVVAVVDEPGRIGFAYGTLPGHQESGEEAFVVERRPEGVVVASVTVDATPATRAARLARPVVARLQRFALGRYLDTWAAFATGQA